MTDPIHLRRDRILDCAKMAASGIRYFGGDRTIDREELVGMCIEKILEHPKWDTESKAVVFARQDVWCRIRSSVQSLGRTTNRHVKSLPSGWKADRHPSLRYEDPDLRRADARMDCETIMTKAGLTERELAVCRGTAQGLSYAEIASAIGRSPPIVWHILNDIRSKCRTKLDRHERAIHAKVHPGHNSSEPSGRQRLHADKRGLRQDPG